MASAFQYEALKFVAFAVQMVSKSCKILPVMLWGVLVPRRGAELLRLPRKGHCHNLRFPMAIT